jgi:alpha-ketoglutarate-dependent taurine dioxygenase
MNRELPHAWTAATIERPESWYLPLPERCLEIWSAKIHDFQHRPSPLTQLVLSSRERAACDLSAALEALEPERGFTILSVPAFERFTPLELQALYWLTGQTLGIPVAQNVDGVLLYDVRDTGQELAQGARFSATRYESSFHTDNSFGDAITDYVGLLCLQTARSGGTSQVVDGLAVYQELRAYHPEALAELGRPFHVDRRGGVPLGEAPTVARPVFETREGEVLFRYLRHWIEVGHQKIDIPLSAAQLAALDTLDEVLRRPELRIDFALRPGEMFFLNNRRLLHNRTAFIDHAEPARRRHLVRLWLQARPRLA